MDKWDEKLLKAITEESKKYYGNFGKIWSLVKADRKHQREIWKKRKNKVVTKGFMCGED